MPVDVLLSNHTSLSVPDWIFVGLIPGLFIVLFWLVKLGVQRFIERMDRLEALLQQTDRRHNEAWSDFHKGAYEAALVPYPNPDEASRTMAKATHDEEGRASEPQ